MIFDSIFTCKYCTKPMEREPAEHSIYRDGYWACDGVGARDRKQHQFHLVVIRLLGFDDSEYFRGF